MDLSWQAQQINCIIKQINIVHIYSIVYLNGVIMIELCLSFLNLAVAVPDQIWIRPPP